MIDSPVFGALFASLAAIVVWVLVLIRVFALAIWRDDDRRFTAFMMPLVGLIASVGTLASAIGYAQQIGSLDWHIPNDTLTFVASMGRGALLIGGLMVLIAYHPRRH